MQITTTAASKKPATAPTTIKAETFSSRIVKFIRAERVERFNEIGAWDSYCFNHTLSLIQRYAYADKRGGIPYRYENICYGIRWSVESGRVNAETVLAMRALKVSELIALVYEVGGKFDTIDKIPAYLMRKYTKVEAKVLQ